jgi:pimeloyl-ACP methyl ester carboxylesterase
VKIIDVGAGPAIVLVPGIQGRWEWMRPAVVALAARCRVITFSLADEPSCGGRFDETEGLSCYVQQIGDALDAAGLQRAAICGVSFGGLIAAGFAAAHPERVTALVLVSALPPGWRPDARVRFFVRAPVLLSPIFCLASLRLYREIRSASDSVASGMGAAFRHGVNVVTHMFSPSRMARRVRLLAGADIAPTLQGLHVPTLVVTGSDDLDRVVPVRLTREYLRLWPHAAHAVIPRTGHLGLITRSGAFAGVVASFVERASGDDGGRGRRVIEAPGASQRPAATGRRVG